MNDDICREMLSRIRAGSIHARYVFDDTGANCYVYGYAGMGEIMGCHLDDHEAKALRQLLADGRCKLGKDIDFVTADMRRKGFDPESGRHYHQSLRIRGREVDAA